MLESAIKEKNGYLLKLCPHGLGLCDCGLAFLKVGRRIDAGSDQKGARAGQKALQPVDVDAYLVDDRQVILRRPMRH